MANGEGREVGVHPDFRRGGGEAGKMVPEVSESLGLVGDPRDVGKGDGLFKQIHRIAVGNDGRIVAPLQGGCGDEAQPGLFGGAAQAGRLLGRGVAGKEPVRQCVVIVPLERGGDPDIGVNQAPLHGGDPPLRWLVVSARGSAQGWVEQSPWCCGP